MVVGEALMASIMACRPPSMRLAISISPSRVSSSTVPISRMYMRTGSVVRPNSLSTVDSAASAASSASSSVAVVVLPPAISSVAASGACSYTAMPMSLSMLMMASRISSLTSFSGRWSLISWCVRKPRVLPILMSVLSSWRRLVASSSVSVVSSRPNSRISARSLARETFMRSGLALAFSSSARTPTRLRLRPRLHLPGRLRCRSGLLPRPAAGLLGRSGPSCQALPLALWLGRLGSLLGIGLGIGLASVFGLLVRLQLSRPWRALGCGARLRSPALGCAFAGLSAAAAGLGCGLAGGRGGVWRRRARASWRSCESLDEEGGEARHAAPMLQPCRHQKSFGTGFGAKVRACRAGKFA
jgi:hypothetical protein